MSCENTHVRADVRGTSFFAPRYSTFFIQGFFSVALFFCFINVADAATLRLSPASGTYAAGKTFSVDILVSSSDQAMNAASGLISFPADKLQVTSVSKTGSIISLWAQEPAYSNTAGTINFEGIVLNPGYTGSSGKLLTITFKAKAAGAAAMTFGSGSVLANDGKGTNILDTLQGANFSVGGAVAPAATPVTPPKATVTEPVGAGLSSPVVTSSTHPDSGKWYSNNDPAFAWALPSDVTGVSVAMDQKAGTDPGTNKDSYTYKDVTYKNVADGTWYFHIRLKNASGWSPVTHYRFRVDTVAPKDFDMLSVDGTETDNPKPSISFETTDSLSGIDHYRITIGSDEPVILSAEAAKGTPYTLPLQTPGKKSILIEAFDKAGNSSSASGSITIRPLTTPEIRDYPTEIKNGENIVVQGRSNYSNVDVNLYYSRDGGTPQKKTVKGDDSGDFTVTLVNPKSGSYQVWVEISDSRGALSLPSSKIKITVGLSGLMAVGTFAVDFLSVVVPLIGLLALLLLGFWYIWHKFMVMRVKLRKEVKEAGRSLHKAFDLLRDDVHDQIKMLEKVKSKRQLTDEEEKIIKQLKKHFEEAEAFVGKEIENIEKEIK